MPSFKKVLLIQNPASGVGWGRPISRRVLVSLKNWIPLTSRFLTKGPGDATSLAKEAEKNGYDLVMVSGGDGTVNEVINGMIGTTSTLAILPSGTGNSLAREVGLPINPISALKVLRGGSVHDIFLGQANGRYFGLMVGIGFDAEAVHRVSFKFKRVFGRLSYVLSGIRSLFGYSFPYFKVNIDGQAFEATTAIICKSRYYASHFQLAPKASLQDPSFQVCLFTGRGFWRYVNFCLSVMENRHTRLKDVVMMMAKEVSVEPVQGLKAQMDGDPLPQVPTSIKIAKEQIKMLFWK